MKRVGCFCLYIYLPEILLLLRQLDEKDCFESYTPRSRFGFAIVLELLLYRILLLLSSVTARLTLFFLIYKRCIVGFVVC
jgi:hypothetical protein